MSKKVLLIAGALLAAGKRCGHLRPTLPRRPAAPRSIFGEFGDGDSGPAPGRFGERSQADGCRQGRRRHAQRSFSSARDTGFARFDKNKDGFVMRRSSRPRRKHQTAGQAVHQSASMPTATARSARKNSPRLAASASPCATSTTTAASAPRICPRAARAHRALVRRSCQRPSGRQGPRARQRGWQGWQGRQWSGAFTLDQLLSRPDRQFSASTGTVTVSSAPRISRRGPAERTAYRRGASSSRFDMETRRPARWARTGYNRFARDRFANLDLDEACRRSTGGPAADDA